MTTRAPYITAALLKRDEINAVLLDIEGTVCPITYVRDVMFPYALRALPTVLQPPEWDSDAFRPYKESFPKEFQKTPEAFEAHVHDLTTRDIKASYLKELQGYLWKRGFEEGELRAPLFADVEGMMKRWVDPALRAVRRPGIQMSVKMKRKGPGKRTDIYIYSSGSVAAQKLLFGHVADDEGVADESDSKKTRDLTGLITGCFDTVTAGPKLDFRSYLEIARKTEIEPGRWLFLTDNPREAEAAIKAEMAAVLVVRPGNAPLNAYDSHKHHWVESFEDIDDDLQLEYGLR